MSARNSQDVVLVVTSATSAAVRDSQDVALVAGKPTTAKARNSQDLSLSAQLPTTAKVRVSQDVTLVITHTSGARNSQDLTLAAARPTSAKARLSQDLTLYVLANTNPPPAPVSSCLPYYSSLITSEYQNSPKYLAFLAVMIGIFCDIKACVAAMPRAFDVNYVVGVQLDILGQILGVSRTVPFQPSGGINPVLSDSVYRILLKAKIAQNQWDGQLGSLWAIWQSLFPGGTIYVIDNQNMTATIILSGSFTSIIQDLITNGLIIPRPEAVLYNFAFATLPIFGFDGVNNAFVAGFDRGHWA